MSLDTAAELCPERSERQHWLAVLAKAPLDQLEAAWEALDDKPAHRLLRRSETGLVMLRGRIGGTGPQFNLGEMTMSRAAVQLVGDGGAGETGFGHVAGRSTRHAELVALFDAMLQSARWHDAIGETVIEPLAMEQQAVRAAEAAKVAASRVDFFTMVRGE